MVNKACFLIVDLDTSHIYEVATITSYVRERYGLVTCVLVQSSPPSEYRTRVEQIIVVARDQADFVKQVRQALNAGRQLPQAGLILSDNEHCDGARLMQALSLPVDDPRVGQRACSNEAYRQAEINMREECLAQGMVVPDHKVCGNLDEVKEFVAAHGQGVVIKPRHRSRDRAACIVHDHQDVENNLELINPYLAAGVICESYIDFPCQYSHEGVGDLSLITEQMITSGPYPAPYAQIVPARLSEEAWRGLTKAGNFIHFLCGQRHAPYHNHLLWSQSKKQVAVTRVESRPADMRVWDLAQRVYGINLYHHWVDQVMGRALYLRMDQASGTGITLLLESPADGRLRTLHDRHGLKLFMSAFKQVLEKRPVLRNNLQWFGFTMIKAPGNQLSTLPRKSDDFVAQVSLHYTAYMQPEHVIELIQNEWASSLSPFIERIHLDQHGS